MKQFLSAGCFTLAGIMAIAAFQTATSTQPSTESLTNTVRSIQQMALDEKQTHVIVDPGTTHKNPIAIFYGLLSAGFGVGGTVIISLKDENSSVEDLPLLSSADGAVGISSTARRVSRPEPEEFEPVEEPVTPVNLSKPGTSMVSPSVATSPASFAAAYSKYDWIRQLTYYPCLLIYGAQGSGKTTLASQIVHNRLKAGHRVIVLDPHKKAGDWKGLECYGAGLNYGEINGQLRWFDKEVESRYKVFSEDENYAPTDVTLICDEFTNWASRCEGADKFFAAAMSDIRKIKIHVIFLSHGRTLATLGDAKGLGGTRDAGLMEVELLAEPDPATGKPRPKFEGFLRAPGKSMNEREAIALPKIKPNFDFSSYYEEEPEPLDAPSGTWQEIEEMYNRPEAPPSLIPVPNDLPDTLRVVLDFAKEKGSWVSARDVQRKNFSILKNYNSDDIRGVFIELADVYDVGELRGCDSSLEYRCT